MLQYLHFPALPWTWNWWRLANIYLEVQYIIVGFFIGFFFGIGNHYILIPLFFNSSSSNKINNLVLGICASQFLFSLSFWDLEVPIQVSPLKIKLGVFIVHVVVSPVGCTLDFNLKTIQHSHTYLLFLKREYRISETTT